MKKKPGFMAVLLSLTGLLLLASLIFFSYNTYRQICLTEKDLEQAMEPIYEKQKEMKEDADALSEFVKEKSERLKHQTQKAQTSIQGPIQERAPGAAQQEKENQKPSVFSQTDSGQLFSDSADTPSSNGHIIGIDPGHQGPSVDMSGQEPIGPGASETKQLATSGTSGAYTGIPEYQLNLDVSLKLQKELTARGYQVVMTRTDNDTAISNKERAEYVAAQGAEIYIRIHANGEESHTQSGALAMAPSSDNPYVSQLSPASSHLSQCILDAYCNATGFQNLGVQFYDNMTGINWSSVPVTILEMGFMTSENDDRKMNDPSFQNTMVQGIADGIDAYFAA